MDEYYPYPSFAVDPQAPPKNNQDNFLNKKYFKILNYNIDEYYLQNLV